MSQASAKGARTEQRSGDLSIYNNLGDNKQRYGYNWPFAGQRPQNTIWPDGVRMFFFRGHLLPVKQPLQQTFYWAFWNVTVRFSYSVWKHCNVRVINTAKRRCPIIHEENYLSWVWLVEVTYVSDQVKYFGRFTLNCPLIINYGYTKNTIIITSKYDLWRVVNVRMKRIQITNN